MSITSLSFGDPGESRYDVYKGDLGVAVFVRIDGRLLGVANDWQQALRLIRSDIARRRECQRLNPVFYMAA